MAGSSSIEWTDATWNPITGCTLVSEGCRNCYAARLAATRLKNHPSRVGLARLNAAGNAKFTGEVRFNEQWLEDPLRWTRPRMIFVCAHGDLFHEAVPDEWIDLVFRVMAIARRHTFQVLTKRPARAAQFLTAPGREAAIRSKALGWPLPNVWLGTSVEDQATANARIPHLLAALAAVRFLSAEPLLGPLDLVLRGMRGWDEDWTLDALTGKEWASARDDSATDASGPHVDWVIAGGESGPRARPMHPAWARSLRDQCAAAAVPFFFKQWGEYTVSEFGATGGARPPVPMHGFKDLLTWNGVSFVRPAPRAKVQEVIAPGKTIAVPCGKALAGRLLDGIEHNAMPEARQ